MVNMTYNGDNKTAHNIGLLPACNPLAASQKENYICCGGAAGCLKKFTARQQAVNRCLQFYGQQSADRCMKLRVSILGVYAIIFLIGCIGFTVFNYGQL